MTMHPGILHISAVCDAMASAEGVRAYRTDWQALGQFIRQGSSPTEFILVNADGTEQPWSKPADDLLARDWIVFTPTPPPPPVEPEGGETPSQ